MTSTHITSEKSMNLRRNLAVRRKLRERELEEMKGI